MRRGVGMGCGGGDERTRGAPPSARLGTLPPTRPDGCLRWSRRTPESVRVLCVRGGGEERSSGASEAVVLLSWVCAERDRCAWGVVARSRRVVASVTRRRRAPTPNARQLAPPTRTGRTQSARRRGLARETTSWFGRWACVWPCRECYLCEVIMKMKRAPQRPPARKSCRGGRRNAVRAHTTAGHSTHEPTHHTH